MTPELSDAELDGLVRGAVSAPRTRPDGRHYRFVRPLVDAADELVRFASSPHDRFFLNVAEVDGPLMGLGRAEMMLVTGFSASAKTQLVLNAIVTQPHKRTLIATADESATLVLSKLIGLSRGISARELIERIQLGDAEAAALVRDVAAEDFPNLLVQDGSLSFEDLYLGYDEAADFWGNAPDVVVVDYLGLIRNGEEDTGSSIINNARRLKELCHDKDVPVVAMHQGTRASSGKGGAVLLSEAGAWGGEAEATALVNVRRKKVALWAQLRDLNQVEKTKGALSPAQRDLRDEIEVDLLRHENTVTVSLLKSKRPGSVLGSPDGTDLWLDPETGRINAISPTAPYMSPQPAAEPTQPPAPQAQTPQELF